MSIKSFEVSGDEEVGDMLSKNLKEEKTEFKVGLVCCGWFEWYGMFEDNYLEKVIKSDARNFYNKLKKAVDTDYKIVFPGIVDTLDSAYEVGKKLARENINLLIIVENTYVTDYIPMGVVDHVPNVPVLIISTQATGNLGKYMTNKEVIRYENLVGNTQLIGAFKKMGKNYDVICGPQDDSVLFEKIYDYIKILELKKDLNSFDIGLLGHTFRGMYDIESDKTKIKGTFGPNIFYIDVQHFLYQWKEISTGEINKYKAWLDKELPFEKYKINEEDREKSIKIALAMGKMIKKFNLDGLSVLGQHHVEVATGASADFLFYEVERNGCVTTHEGDLANLVMKKILKDLSGGMPVFLEWSSFDLETNSLLLTHHGVVDPKKYAADIKKCRWTPSPERWDIKGNGLSVEFSGREGKVTLASLIDEKDSWKIIISGGECIALEKRPCFAPQFYFKPVKIVTDYLEDIMNEGVSHHLIMAYGDYKKQLKILANHLKIRYVYL
ncbi:MAG: hypothetical protein JW770_01410 [Actinobacteria bacterium]|nr:hypothetical protein [Actinomycetota bacterium]